MEILVFSTFADTIITNDLRHKLATVGTLVIIQDPLPLDTLTTILGTPDDKIVAIDPRFFNWSVPPVLFDSAQNLKAICLQSTSFGWIDVEQARIKGIAITNLRGFSTSAVAEWATMMALILARRVPLILKNQLRPGATPLFGTHLEGKTAGIIGMGRIGSALAAKLYGLQMTVQYWSRKSINTLYRSISLDDLMRTSDVIFPTLAKNNETAHLISRETLSTMKQSAIFVSIVPEIYDHSFLLKLVEQDQLYGYGFESRNTPNLLDYNGNIWATSELAWYTDRSLSLNSEQWIASILDATAGHFPNRVN